MASEQEQLLELVRTGDGDAFRTLVDRHGRDVFRVVYRIIADHQRAEDAVQETFIKVHRSLGGFDGRSSFATWIHRIAVNCAIDLQRRQARHEAMTGSSNADEQGWLDRLESAEAGPERSAHGRELAEHTSAALQELTTMERTAFTLRHYEGCSIREISTKLDITGNATKQAIFRAVKKLRHILKPLVVAHEGT